MTEIEENKMENREETKEDLQHVREDRFKMEHLDNLNPLQPNGVKRSGKKKKKTKKKKKLTLKQDEIPNEMAEEEEKKADPRDGFSYFRNQYKGTEYEKEL